MHSSLSNPQGIFMKYAVLAALFASSMTALSHAQFAPATASCPTLQFTGLKSGEGTLMIAAYGSADTFFKKPVWMNTIKVDGETMTVPMCNVDASEIAVTAFQDLNGNGKMDSNPMGIPNEPYGASGKPAMFSAPTWNDTKVSFAGVTQPIVIKF
jgi:uncharacterized protein (DUF2141 family)